MVCQPEEDLANIYQGDFVPVDQDQGTAAMDFDQQGLFSPLSRLEAQGDRVVPIMPPAEARQTIRKQRQKKKNPLFDEVIELADPISDSMKDDVLMEYEN